MVDKVFDRLKLSHTLTCQLKDVQYERGHQTEEHDGVELRPAVVEVHVAASDLHLAGHLHAEDGRHEEVNEEGHYGEVQMGKGLEGVAGVHGDADQREEGAEAHEPADGGRLPPQRLRPNDLVQLEGAQAEAGHRGGVEEGGARRPRPNRRPQGARGERRILIGGGGGGVLTLSGQGRR